MGAVPSKFRYKGGFAVFQKAWLEMPGPRYTISRAVPVFNWATASAIVVVH